MAIYYDNITAAIILSGREYCWKEVSESLIDIASRVKSLIVVKNWKKGSSFDKIYSAWKDKIGNLIEVEGNRKKARTNIEKGELIADNYNRYRRKFLHNRTEFLLQLEDDATFPKNALDRIFELLRMYNKAAFSTIHFNHRGYYPDHTGMPMIWSLETRKTFPAGDSSNEECISIRSMGRNIRAGHEKVDAAHCNCTLIRSEFIQKFPFRARMNGLWGHDLVFGYQVSKMGYHGLVDWTLKGSHYECDEYGNVVIW